MTSDDPAGETVTQGREKETTEETVASYLHKDLDFVVDMIVRHVF